METLGQAVTDASADGPVSGVFASAVAPMPSVADIDAMPSADDRLREKKLKADALKALSLLRKETLVVMVGEMLGRMAAVDALPIILNRACKLPIDDVATLAEQSLGLVANRYLRLKTRAAGLQATADAVRCDEQRVAGLLEKALGAHISLVVGDGVVPC